MSIQGVHPRKLLIASLTRERAVIRMQLFMAFTVMLSCESFPTSWPMTLEGLLLIV
jgi:hypothetical protein